MGWLTALCTILIKNTFVKLQEEKKKKRCFFFHHVLRYTHTCCQAALDATQKAGFWPQTSQLPALWALGWGKESPGAEPRGGPGSVTPLLRDLLLSPKGTAALWSHKIPGAAQGSQIRPPPQKKTPPALLPDAGLHLPARTATPFPCSPEELQPPSLPSALPCRGLHFPACPAPPPTGAGGSRPGGGHEQAGSPPLGRRRQDGVRAAPRLRPAGPPPAALPGPQRWGARRGWGGSRGGAEGRGRRQGGDGDGHGDALGGSPGLAEGEEGVQPRWFCSLIFFTPGFLALFPRQPGCLPEGGPSAPSLGFYCEGNVSLASSKWPRKIWEINPKPSVP